MPKTATKRRAYSQRVDAIGKLVAERAEKREERAQRRADEKKSERRGKTRPMVRKNTPDPSRVNLKPIIAYDLETTSIASGTPTPLYLTACGDGGFWFSGEIVGKKHLGEMLIDRKSVV